MPNLWGFYRVRKTDGFIRIKCEKCGAPCFYDPDRMILTNGRYTDKTGTQWVRPFLFFSTCLHCCPPRTIQEYLARKEQMPEKESRKYNELEAKLLEEYRQSKQEGERNLDKARTAAAKGDQPQG